MSLERVNIKAWDGTEHENAIITNGTVDVHCFSNNYRLHIPLYVPHKLLTAPPNYYLAELDANNATIHTR